MKKLGILMCGLSVLGSVTAFAKLEETQLVQVLGLRTSTLGMSVYFDSSVGDAVGVVDCTENRVRVVPHAFTITHENCLSLKDKLSKTNFHQTELSIKVENNEVKGVVEKLNY
ncbi:MAG: hypothetical protein KA715_08905 [Xanthomonadaceae bacterium]|nr:hypothetical protein [Xanthomonadaceae bacterium]